MDLRLEEVVFALESALGRGAGEWWRGLGGGVEDIEASGRAKGTMEHIDNKLVANEEGYTEDNGETKLGNNNGV